MADTKLIPEIYLKDQIAYKDAALTTQIENGDAVQAAVRFSENGADEILFTELSYDDASHDAAIGILRKVTRAVDIPVLAGGNIKRVEDVKKYLYAGARIAVLDAARESNVVMIKEVADRFGPEKIALRYDGQDPDALQPAVDNHIAFLLTEISFLKNSRVLSGSNIVPPILLLETALDAASPVSDLAAAIRATGPYTCYGVTGAGFSIPSCDFMQIKHELQQQGISVNTFSSAIPFSEFKCNADGLIPVVVQDYKTDEVLMVAYMNEESFRKTLETGRMTYFSRSRQQLWTKGETSGHFQFVRSLAIDCDNDTLLAKVKQIGAACHTGNRSCFYRDLVRTEYAETNPLKVFNDVMSVIEDRKAHPKEGSYTNYLFDKGIDKILKKCGEEATEVIIAAKNPDPEEIKYEISDFLYHVMVLMVLRGVTWDDIIKELANR